MKDKIYKYSFITKDKQFAREINLSLTLMKRSYAKFYFKQIECRKHDLFEITTDDPDNKDFKHFLFIVGMKAEGGIKTRAR